MSGVRGFTIVVDYDGMTGGTSSAPVDEETSDEHNRITYIYDASDVKLDNSSRAVIAFGGATDADMAEYRTWLGTGAATNDGKFVLTTANSTEANTIKASGSLTKITGATGFNSALTAEQEGYYAVVTVNVPKNVSTGETTGGEPSEAKIKVYNRATAGDNDPSRPNTKIHTLPTKSDNGEEFALPWSVLVRVNDTALTFGKKEITFTVDWDGDGDNWKETTYTLDLSDVAYNN